MGSRPTSTPSAEIQRLNKIIQERDKQLEEQATALTDMEATLAEIQSLMPEGGFEHEPAESNDVRELRSMLRDRNDKIAMLTAEFDAHRADFRSTIDTLELASTETERVYEKKVDELQAELMELHSRNEDVETVAMQLKQLEELVQELEEGLEDARRGEAEARGEVEFLRGEVERGRSELKREREKAAEVLKSANNMVDGPPPAGQREIEQRDDEIRGLKAIIHSLSSGVPEDHGRSLSREGSSVDPEELKTAQATAERLEREKEELRGLVERKAYREEELEREIEKLKSQIGSPVQRESVVSNAVSEHTVKQEPHSAAKDSKDTVSSWRAAPAARRDPPTPLEPMVESDGRSSAADSVLWCEICETGGHDILNCSAMGGDASQKEGSHNDKDGVVVEALRNLSVSSDHTRPTGLTPTKSPGNAPTTPLPIPSFNHSNSSLVPPKGAAVADPDKWCALCENEGHDVTECPNEDAF
jgi:chromosome segregation ATPase